MVYSESIQKEMKTYLKDPEKIKDMNEMSRLLASFSSFFCKDLDLKKVLLKHYIPPLLFLIAEKSLHSPLLLHL